MGPTRAAVQSLVDWAGLPREPYVNLILLGLKLALVAAAVALVVRLLRKKRGPAVLDFGGADDHMTRR